MGSARRRSLIGRVVEVDGRTLASINYAARDVDRTFPTIRNMLKSGLINEYAHNGKSWVDLDEVRKVASRVYCDRCGSRVAS